MNSIKQIIKTIGSLRNMIAEMNEKDIEFKRITKTASLLLLSGMSKNSIPPNIIRRCIEEQNDEDGGWVSIVDTMWNIFFLKLIDQKQYKSNIEKGLKFLNTQKNKNGLWGRAKRDISRIPVTGIMFYLLPEICYESDCYLLERLWISEKNSLTYKAAYILMAFKRNEYSPVNKHLIEETVNWIVNNQKVDGGFSPWKEHPIDSDVFCTSIATLGLLQYKEMVSGRVFYQAFEWLSSNQLANGIWKYHEIEDGASWGLYAMVELLKNEVIQDG
ncbi:MAG: hypothetical protein M0P77_09580 [Firmicutes bacterium]|nr:hypothetical protein [Bacillota bacterium]